jgi:hypothetical protein
VVLLVLAAVLLGLGGAGILFPRDSEGKRHVLVIDRSASVLPFFSEEELAHLIREHASKFSEKDRLALVFFGSEAIVVQAPAPPSRYDKAQFSGFNPSAVGTNVPGALRLASTLLPVGEGEILLVSDGRSWGGAGGLSRLVSPGLRIHTASAGRVPGGDFGIVSLEAPALVSVGSRVTLTARVVSWSGGEAIIDFRDGRGRPIGKSLKRSFLPRETRIVHASFVARAGGEPRFTAHVAPLAGEDPVSENDSAETVVRIAGVLRVLFLSENPPGRIFEKLLKGIEGLEVEAARPYRLGAQPRFDVYDLVVLDDVTAASLGEARMRALEAFVRESGGGLIQLGGAGGYGAGGYFDTPVERASPLRCDPEEKTSLALVLLLDASGSMAEKVAWKKAKFDFALVALDEVLKRLRPGDYVEVVPFSGAAVRDPALSALVGDSPPDTIWRRLFNHYRPKGTTSIQRALARAGEIMSGRDEPRKHVLLLSDGSENVRTESGGYDDLRNAFERDRVTVSAAVTAENLDADLLEFFTENVVLRGKVYEVEEFTLLARDFIEDVTRARGELVKNGRFTPVSGAVPSGVEVRPAPEVERFVRTGLRKESARAALVLGDEKYPLLAWRRYGMGRSLAFTTSLEDDWAPAWRKWGRPSEMEPGLLEFWEDWIRWTARDSGGGMVRVFGSPEGLLVRVESRSGEALPDGMKMRAKLIHRGRAVSHRKLVQEGFGRYVVEFPVESPGYYRVAVMEEGGERVFGEGGVYAGSSREMGALGPDPESLQRLCAGGGEHWEDLSLFQPSPPSTKNHSWVDAGWMLCVAAAISIVLFAFSTGRRSLGA